MTITLYNFSKRRNSTAIPSTAGTDYTVTLKSPTSELRPVFILRYSGQLAHNYLKWGNRYYWITDAVHRENGIMEISASVDALASWRSAIFASSAFVLYDTEANTEISDSRLSLKTTAVEARESGSFPTLGTGISNRSVVITVTGRNGIGSYYVPESDAKTILADVKNWADNAIDPTTSITDVQSAIESLGESFLQAGRNLISAGDAANNIRSAVLLPLPASAFSGTQQPVMLGLYQSGVVGTLLSNITFSDWADVAIPWPASDWRRNSPYTSVRLFIPWVGLVSFPPSALIGVSTLSVQAIIDLRTGDALFVVFANRGGNLNVIGRYNTNVGASYPIGSSNISPLAGVGAVGSIAGSVAAAISAANPAGLIAAGAAGILGMTNSVQALDQCVGGAGSAAGFGLSPNIVCYTIFHDTVVAPLSISAAIGTPAMAVKTIGSLSGFVQTRAASVSCEGTQQEIDEINSSLDGGVFIE